MPDDQSDDDVPHGITKFFSSQADVLLAQYENINNLLGTTDDYTGPGTHCEVLLRDFLRNHLPSWLGVDKGFIFGRTKRWGEEKDKASGNTIPVEKELHSPEIDILIHDTFLHRPVFRLEDFVIVQPEAVLAVIQVKRSLSATNQFKSGISNVVSAKRHLLEMHFQKMNSRNWMPNKSVFSAVVEFADNNDRKACTFKTRLEEAHSSQEKYESKDKEHATAWVLPSYIGSLAGKFAMTVSSGVRRDGQDFALYSGIQGDHNVSLQALLFRLTTVLWAFSNTQLRQVTQEQPPFAFPDDMRAIEQFSIPSKG